MFTSDEIKKAWMILSLKGEVDHHGWDNINKVLDFLDNKFNETYQGSSSKQHEGTSIKRS